MAQSMKVSSSLQCLSLRVGMLPRGPRFLKTLFLPVYYQLNMHVDIEFSKIQVPWGAFYTHTPTRTCTHTTLPLTLSCGPLIQGYSPKMLSGLQAQCEMVS